MSGSGEVGRNLRQVYNTKGSQSCTLASLLSVTKVSFMIYWNNTTSVKMVLYCRVNFADGVMSIVATDQKLDDVLHFCANNSPGFSSVLGIDPTLTLGNFM